MSDEWKSPDKAKTEPKRITTKNPPGGPHTPGAKENAEKTLQERDIPKE